MTEPTKSPKQRVAKAGTCKLPSLGCSDEDMLAYDRNRKQERIKKRALARAKVIDPKRKLPRSWAPDTLLKTGARELARANRRKALRREKGVPHG